MREAKLYCLGLTHQNQRNRVFAIFADCNEVFSEKPGF